MADAPRIEIGGEPIDGTVRLSGETAEIAFVREFDGLTAARLASLFAEVEIREGLDVAFLGEVRVVTIYRHPGNGRATVLVAAVRLVARC